MKSVIILGGKEMGIDIEKLLSNFDNICRINLNTNCMKDEFSNKTTYFLNCHVYQNFYKTSKGLGVLQKEYSYTDENALKYFYDIIKEKKYYKNVLSETVITTEKVNKILEILGCPHVFHKLPRCGYKAIFHHINHKFKVIVGGFSINNNNMKTVYNPNKTLGHCHDYHIELKILLWLHNNNHIDATLCILENKEIPTLDCSYLSPNYDTVKLLVENNGLCALNNYIQEENDIHTKFKNVTFENNSCTIKK